MDGLAHFWYSWARYAVEIALGVLILYVIYRATAKRKLARWWLEGTITTPGQPPRKGALSASVASPEATHRTRTLLYFWNAGRPIISSEHIPEHTPLRVEAEEGAVIVSCHIARQWGPRVLARTLRPDAGRTRVPLEFCVLARNEGFVVEVVHTGSSPERVAINGAIGGSGRIERVPQWSPGAAAYRALRTSVGLAIMSAYFALWFLRDLPPHGRVLVAVGCCLLVAAPAVWLIAEAIRARRPYPRQLMPRHEMW